jgi:carbonic anhydrase/acetyltransferase-like protein (isoleucine patch superfamily)
MERIRKVGVKSLWLTSGRRDGTVTRSELAGFVRQGVKRLLVIKLNSYAEMDLRDFFRFHCEKRNPITEARDSRGELGVSLLDQFALGGTLGETENPFDSAQDGRVPYEFNGYAKRILSANERQELVGDALTGACAMRPFGKQIRENVWVGENVEICDSARVVGPTYIGERTIIRAGATIGPFASVERDCVVDCGTTVERSTVMPQTYLAPGILIQDGVVDGGYLEHLGWGTVVDLRPAGLGSRIARRQVRKPASCEVPVEGVAEATQAPVWGMGSTAVAGQPWLQVRL